jgi:hypothetical protein
MTGGPPIRVGKYKNTIKSLQITISPYDMKARIKERYDVDHPTSFRYLVETDPDQPGDNSAPHPRSPAVLAPAKKHKVYHGFDKFGSPKK